MENVGSFRSEYFEISLNFKLPVFLYRILASFSDGRALYNFSFTSRGTFPLYNIFSLFILILESLSEPYLLYPLVTSISSSPSLS